MQANTLTPKIPLTYIYTGCNINIESNKGKFFGVGCNSLLAVKARNNILFIFAAVRDLFIICNYKWLIRCESGTNSKVWMKEERITAYKSV